MFRRWAAIAAWQVEHNVVFVQSMVPCMNLLSTEKGRNLFGAYNTGVCNVFGCQETQRCVAGNKRLVTERSTAYMEVTGRNAPIRLHVNSIRAYQHGAVLSCNPVL